MSDQNGRPTNQWEEINGVPDYDRIREKKSILKELESDQISLVETCQEWTTIYQLKCDENSRLSALIEDVKKGCDLANKMSSRPSGDYLANEILDIINKGEKNG